MYKYFLLTIAKTSVLLTIIVLTSACSTITDARKQKKSYMFSYYSGNLEEAATALSKKSTNRSDTTDELMWRLDAGVANFTAGEYHKSIAEFKRCEAIIKDFDDRAVINARAGAAEIGAVLTNLNALPYKGMYLDKVMLNAYKALGYFAIADPTGAEVELRKMRHVQKMVVRQFAEEIRQTQKEVDAQNRNNQRASTRNASMSFSYIAQNPVVSSVYRSSGNKANKLYGNLSNPFVSYFSAMGYLMNNNYSEALVDFRNLYKMLPNNKLIQQDYVSIAKAIGSKIPAPLKSVKALDYPLNQKMVYILLFNGRAPALKQEKFQIILPSVGYTGVAFPRYEYFPSSLQSLTIDALYHNQQISVQTEQIADFDAIMSQEYHERLPGMITRIVVSTLAKEIASYAAVQAVKSPRKNNSRDYYKNNTEKNSRDNFFRNFPKDKYKNISRNNSREKYKDRHRTNRSGNEAQLAALILTGIYKALFNTADTRGWETLPQEVQIAHVPIPDNGILKITPIRAGKTTEIKLKNDTNIAIVYIRALSANNLIYKLFEIK